MMMVVDITASRKPFMEVKHDLDEIGQGIGVSIHVQREEIFDMMHRI